jgi:hypothetical protein
MAALSSEDPSSTTTTSKSRKLDAASAERHCPSVRLPLYTGTMTERGDIG